MIKDRYDIRIDRTEIIFVLGIVVCLLLSTLELARLMLEEWFEGWVNQNTDTNQRLILYSLAFIMVTASMVVSVVLNPRFGRFGNILSRSFLWYGSLLLIGTIGFFLFDCLSEVIAGILGAGILTGSLYLLQKGAFNKDIAVRIHLNRGECPQCSSYLPPDALFCSDCCYAVGKNCPDCERFAQLSDKHCSHCGRSLSAV